MIWESEDWKKPLRQMAKRLRSLKNADDLTEKNLTQIERDLFIGFYSIRKLFDAVVKVTNATRSSHVKVSWYPNLRPVDWRNNHRIESLYDFKRKRQESRDLQFIAGRIIHSFIFAPFVGEQGGLGGIFFTSDVDKDKKLYAMEIDEVITAFERVGTDGVSKIYRDRDPKTGKDILKLS
jgi:hypothetical protein